MRTSIAILPVCGAFIGCSAPDPAAMSVNDYKAEAMAAVASIDVGVALELDDDDSVVFVDVREGDEIATYGHIEGAVPVPRGVLEFYIDQASPMHMDIFSSGKKVVFYCETGGRSLLAAKLAKDMGLSDPAYLEGGFKAWADAGGVVVR